MKRVCFDASLALAFVLNDEPYHAQAVALITDLAGESARIIAPPIFLCECDSTIRLRVYKGALSDEDASTARIIIAALAIGIESENAIYDRAFEIARIHNQPRTYDATYAALAESHGLELWTADKRFYNSVSGALPFVKFIGNY